MEEQAVYGEEYEPEKHSESGMFQNGTNHKKDIFKPFEFWAEEGGSYEISGVIDRERFVAAWEEMQAEVHHIAVSKGWWDTDRSDGEIIALIHSELSEALEASRKGYPADKHIPHHGNLEVELADVVIRIMDFAGSKGRDVASALMDKVEFNRSRPRKHGKLF